METELHAKPPRPDPDRWKPLLKLILAVLMIVPLASIEYMLVSEMLRSGSLRGLFQVILYGLILVMLLYALVVGVWRWLNQPSAEQMVQQARVVLDQKLARTTLVSRSRSPTPPNKVIYAALPITFLILAIYGVCIDRWVMFFVMLIGAIVIGGAMLLVFSREKQVLFQTLAIDSNRRVVRFENFQFISTFLPEKPRAQEEIGFDQILGVDFSQSGEGLATLLIRTTKGSVTITSRVENFDEIHAIMESLVVLNKADRDKYQEKLNAEQEIKTPWYGWLILLGGFTAVGLLVWKFMYSD